MTRAYDLPRLKLAVSLAAEAPALTRRDVRLPGIKGKAFAVIGVRRCGKTSILAQCRAERLAAGSTREAQLFLSLEDERLDGLTVADLALHHRDRLLIDCRLHGGACESGPG